MWNGKQIRSLLMSVGWKALLAVVSVPMWGAPLPCAETTLQSYISLAEGCTVDSLLFSNFVFGANTATSNPDTGDILISPLLSAGPDGWSGIRITAASGQFLLLGPQLNIDFEIHFTVSTASPYSLYAASLFTDANTSGSGNHARVREFVDYGGGEVQMQSNQGSNGAHIREFAPTESVEVTKIINLDTAAQGGTSAISFIDQGFDQGSSAEVPEPTTIILGGCGLLAIGCCRRRSRLGKR